MKDFKIAISVLGRPGSGKDTQADLLAEKFGLVHVISSKLIKKTLSVKEKSIRLGGRAYNLEKERYLQNSGFLNTPSFVLALVKAEIKKIADKKKGIVMSGSSRTLIELKIVLPLLKKLYGDYVYFFHIKISPAEVYVRNLKRHRKDLPELDTKKMIKKRLEVFNKETLPVIGYLKSKKLIIDINGEQPIAKIHKDILKILLPQLSFKTKLAK